MWCYDELSVSMNFGKMLQYFIVITPSTSRNNNWFIFAKPFNTWVFFSGCCNSKDSIKSSISRYTDAIRKNDVFKQISRTLILHKKMGDIQQHLSVKSSIPLKK